MRFCKRLASQEGFTITFANIASIHNMIEEARIKEAETIRPEEDGNEGGGEGRKEKLDIRRVCLPFHFDIPKMSNSDKKVEAFFGALSGLAPHIEELLEKLMNAEPPTANLSGLLYIHYILQGTLALNTVLEVLSNKEQAKDGDFATNLAGLPTLTKGDLLDFIDNNPFVYKVYVEALQQSREKSLAIAVNTFEELERDAMTVDFGIPIFAVGPLVDSLDKEYSTSMWREDQDWMKWLDSQSTRSVLYISFGSLAALTKAQYEEIVAGLLSSEIHFLWVVRPDLVTGTSYEDISNEINLKSNDKGHIISWAPQTRVLAHPAIGGFLTHCGWNSTIEAISNGVPMICFPYISDQFMNATLIKKVWQVGLGFEIFNEIGIIDRSEIERIVKLLMQEGSNSLHVNTKHYQRHSLESLQSTGMSSKSIKHLASLV
ncbi:hypothetical protein GOP47_0028505 [Adiantum capillus-veneris]|nr:hypothetical protein GOP47_0028505 [Adiantum capillus-veneris]